MRIAHVTHTFPPYRGGTGNVCYYNARELARRGHDVHVFTAAMAGELPIEHRENMIVHRLRPFIQVGNAPVLLGLVNELRHFELVHIHCPYIFGGEFTALVAALYRQPLIVTYHNDLIKSGGLRDLIFSAATWSSRHIVYYNASKMLFVSQGHAATCDQKELYLRHGNSEIVPNGVDTFLFSPVKSKLEYRDRLGVERDTFLIGFVGGLDKAHHYKGLDLLLEVLATKDLDSPSLIVVGDGELKAHYMDKARSLGISKRVIFYGEASQEELPDLYRACDIVTVPSTVPESFGLVIVEAFACGIPVIASEGPGTRTIINNEHNGLLVPMRDRAALIAAIKYVQFNRPLREKMGAAGRQKVEEVYDWRGVGGRLEQIYFDVLASRTSSTFRKPEQNKVKKQG